MARFTPSPRHSVGSSPVRARTRTWPVALALAFVLTNLFSFSAGRLGQLGLPAGGSAAPQAALAAPRPDGGGQAVVGQPVTPRRAALHPSTTPPTPTAQQRQARQAALDRLRRYKKPVGPVHPLTAAETATLARTAGPPLPMPKTTRTTMATPKTTTTPVARRPIPTSTSSSSASSAPGGSVPRARAPAASRT